ncbi:hypothetical protein [Natronolimnobius baerhuensis]|uniref:hypothetical protein n=1 Tax=Natronolimnobius baerhuensis TaxID=253108 RepID=UPI001124FDF4|nr:hypothetical protein [Natronolimnobius baerhuensis]
MDEEPHRKTVEVDEENVRRVLKLAWSESTGVSHGFVINYEVGCHFLGGTEVHGVDHRPDDFIHVNDVVDASITQDGEIEFLELRDNAVTHEGEVVDFVWSDW